MITATAELPAAPLPFPAFTLAWAASTWGGVVEAAVHVEVPLGAAEPEVRAALSTAYTAAAAWLGGGWELPAGFRTAALFHPCVVGVGGAPSPAGFRGGGGHCRGRNASTTLVGGVLRWEADLPPLLLRQRGAGPALPGLPDGRDLAGCVHTSTRLVCGEGGVVLEEGAACDPAGVAAASQPGAPFPRYQLVGAPHPVSGGGVSWALGGAGLHRPEVLTLNAEVQPATRPPTLPPPALTAPWVVDGARWVGCGLVAALHVDAGSYYALDSRGERPPPPLVLRSYAAYIDVEAPATASTQHLVLLGVPLVEGGGCGGGTTTPGFPPTVCVDGATSPPVLRLRGNLTLVRHLRYQPPGCPDDARAAGYAPSTPEGRGCVRPVIVLAPTLYVGCGEMGGGHALDALAGALGSPSTRGGWVALPAVGPPPPPPLLPVGGTSHAFTVDVVTLGVRSLASLALCVLVADKIGRRLVASPGMWRRRTRGR